MSQSPADADDQTPPDDDTNNGVEPEESGIASHRAEGPSQYFSPTCQCSPPDADEHVSPDDTINIDEELNKPEIESHETEESSTTCQCSPAEIVFGDDADKACGNAHQVTYIKDLGSGHHSSVVEVTIDGQSYALKVYDCKRELELIVKFCDGEREEQLVERFDGPDDHFHTERRNYARLQRLNATRGADEQLPVCRSYGAEKIRNDVLRLLPHFRFASRKTRSNVCPKIVLGQYGLLLDKVEGFTLESVCEKPDDLDEEERLVLQTVVEDLDTLYEQVKDVFAHGSLYERNVMFDRHQKKWILLDFGRAEFLEDYGGDTENPNWVSVQDSTQDCFQGQVRRGAKKIAKRLEQTASSPGVMA